MTPSPFPPLSEQSCATCRYHVDGQCRRQSPRVATPPLTGMADPAYRSIWPYTYTSDWCGEWSSKEEA